MASSVEAQLSRLRQLLGSVGQHGAGADSQVLHPGQRRQQLIRSLLGR